MNFGNTIFIVKSESFVQPTNLMYLILHEGSIINKNNDI
jgi:hypothetical protein